MSLYHRRRDRTGPIWPIQRGHDPTDRPDLWEVVQIDDAAIKPRPTLESVINAGYGEGITKAKDVATLIRMAFPEAGL